MSTSQEHRLCKDCKWWDSPPEWTREPSEWGYCELTEDELPKYREGVPVTKAYVPYMDHWAAPDRLATAPDFGCVQFELKEEFVATTKRKERL